MEIVLRHIFKSYSDKPIIQDFSLTIKSGSFTTLLGPSGCGKTTLLRMIAGLEIPDKGEIYLGDTCVFSSTKHIFIPPEKRHLGFVFQDFALWPHMTVFENVAFGLRATGQTSHIDEIVTKALGQVELFDFQNRYPNELSGGQQQRVAFARAIAYGKDCILFDEPLSALDAKLRVEMRREIRDLVSKLHVTAVFVTHDQMEAMEMSDAIAVLSQGCTEQYGPPENIYHQPATTFVAKFVGSSNWIDGHHLFRPEKARLFSKANDISYEVSIISSQFRGQDYQIHLDWQGKTWTLLSPTAICAEKKMRIYVNPNDIITV
ncbi:MAG TPA: ABC transporter ATP-binding protein [Dialister sp.]|nr:ABC transporter ATP-binding protein [Dialister sp.]